MSEQQTVKVYELAKELGTDSLALLDKLKSMNISVKNHMSDLTREQLEMARSAYLSKSQAKPTKKPAAKVAVRKTSATSSTSQATTEASSASTSKTEAKREVKKEAKKATKIETKSEPSKSASPIVRRRRSEDGTSQSTVTSGSLETHTSTHDSEVEAQHPAATHQDLDQASHETHSADFTSQESLESEEVYVPPVPTAPTVMRPRTAEPEAPVIPPSPKLRSVKLETRSLLKIIEKAPPASASRPTMGRTTTDGKDSKFGEAGKDTPRVFKMTKEALDRMVEEESVKKRPGGERNLNPEDVKFADYRKKEVVFLPKRKKVPVGKTIHKTQITKMAAHKRVVEMTGPTLSVQDLANQMNVKAVDVIRKLMSMGQMATINQAIDFDTATLVAAEFQFEVKNVAFNEENLLAQTDNEADQVSRPPVVTIMGHVDHGKTSLLDAVRDANVAAGEAGGITQHIGAYTIQKNGKYITFIDTPGHEAFSHMRSRGANVTDIVILVVAADDGVMPQTREAISHAKAAKVPMIVAVNKMDKPGANPEKVKQMLAELDVLAEDWGGETIFAPVSALKKTGLSELLESILLTAEMLDLKANPKLRAEGTVLEARLEKGRGPVISVLINKGTLKVGDPILAGSFAGKVRALNNHLGQQIKSITPGMAAEILGLEGTPNAGDGFWVTPSDDLARQIASDRQKKDRASQNPTTGVTLDTLFSKVQAGDMKELGVILKADVFGSCEAVKESLLKLSTEKVKLKVIHAAPGGITESDVLLASASKALIIGFNVRPETKARELAEREHIEIRHYNIIYNLIEDVQKAMAGLLDKTKVEKYLGRAEIRQIFSAPKIGTIAGCSVVDGKITRTANVRLLRDSRVIIEGKLGSLKRFKDDAKEVAQGFECGMSIENYNDIKVGDIIEAFEIELIAGEM